MKQPVSQMFKKSLNSIVIEFRSKVNIVLHKQDIMMLMNEVR